MNSNLFLKSYPFRSSKISKHICHFWFYILPLHIWRFHFKYFNSIKNVLLHSQIWFHIFTLIYQVDRNQHLKIKKWPQIHWNICENSCNMFSYTGRHKLLWIEIFFVKIILFLQMKFQTYQSLPQTTILPLFIHFFTNLFWKLLLLLFYEHINEDSFQIIRFN